MRITDIIQSNPVKPKRFRMNFSCNSKPVEVKKTIHKNFSENPELSSLYYELTNFSLKERILESKQSPKRVLNKRVREVAKYLGRASRSDLEANKKIVLGYLNEYIYTTIAKLINDRNQENVNIILTLGLSNLISDLSSVRELQKVLKRVKNALLSKGYIPKEMQLLLNKHYQKFWDEFKMVLEDNYCSEANKGALTGRENIVTVDEGNDEYKMAAFSKVKNNELEKLLLGIADNDSFEDKDFDPLFDYLKSDKTVYKEILGDAELANKVNEFRKSNNRADLESYIKGLSNFSLDLSLADSVFNGTDYADPKDGSNEESNDESTPNKDLEVISKSENMEFGVIRNSNKAYVAFSHKDGYKVTIYRLPKGLKVTNFSELVNLPSKSIKIKSMNELIIRR